MRRLWIGGVVVAFVVSSAGFAAAGQAAGKPAPKTAGVAQEAKKPAATAALPATVATAFTKAYPDAVIKNSSKETENGKVVYEVESVDKGLNRDLLYAADGTVLECEEQVAEADIPAPVLAALKQLYPKATVTKAEKTTKGQAIQFDLALKGAPKAEVSFLPDGKPVPAAPGKK
jgi:uncharacterized cupredoxin-like copper-binding protein